MPTAWAQPPALSLGHTAGSGRRRGKRHAPANHAGPREGRNVTLATNGQDSRVGLGAPCGPRPSVDRLAGKVTLAAASRLAGGLGAEWLADRERPAAARQDGRAPRPVTSCHAPGRDAAPATAGQGGRPCGLHPKFGVLIRRSPSQPPSRGAAPTGRQPEVTR